MPGVRTATVRDFDRVLPLLRSMHRESTQRVVKFEEAQLRRFFQFCTSHPSHTCLVYESAGSAIEGLIIGHLNNYFFSTELGAWDLLVYVRPEKRGSIVAGRLFKAFKAWAKRAGARTLWMGTSAGIELERARRFYVGMGMAEVGSVFVQRLR